MKKTMEKYNKWVREDSIIEITIHEDYDDITYYTDVNGDMICIQRDEHGNIIDAYEE